jgi:tryptophanyl-tRNA synthetase
MKKIILTGDRPTGPLHLGHYVGSLANRVTLQDTYEQYVMIADVQALTDNFDNPTKVIESVYQVAADYLSIGIDPEKTTIFIQSQIPELTELTTYYLNLVTLGRLERNPTVKTEIQQKGFGDSIPVGFFCYPISQAADITLFKAEVVPVGEDQLPMIELSNEIVRRFNRTYTTTCLKEAHAYLSNAPRLVGIDGKAKAGKSLGNAIFLSDAPEVIKQKVFSMYTDPEHIHVKDPGKVEGNVVFTYLDAFHHDKEEVEHLKKRYAQGGLGDVTLKNMLNETLQTFLKPIREKRSSLQHEEMRAMLMKGTAKARMVGQKTLHEVRTAIGLHYF